jgi:hypothetical protein
MTLGMPVNERDDEPCLCGTPFTCLATHEGCYICRPDDPSANPEGCPACEARSDAYHEALRIPLPKG